MSETGSGPRAGPLHGPLPEAGEGGRRLTTFAFLHAIEPAQLQVFRDAAPEVEFLQLDGEALPRGLERAEAGAIAAMVAAGETELIEVAVIADAPQPVPPCGGCRQKLAEFGRGETPVLLATTSGRTLATTVGELLPGRFEVAHMSGVETE